MQTTASVTDAVPLKGLGIKPVASLIAHWRAALCAFALVLLAGAPFAWIKGAPHYTATATVEVAPNYMKNLKDDKELEFQSNQQYRQFVEHQARSVTRYDILSSALAALGAHTAQLSGDTPRGKVRSLRERLAVRTIPDTYLMEISLEAREKDSLAAIVNAVVDAYLARMKDEQMFGAAERVKNLDAREKQLLAQVDAKSKRRTAIALELGVTTFNDGEGSPYDKLLADTRSALADARNQRMAAESKLNGFLRKGETDITTRSIGESILTDPGLNSFKAALNSRRAALVTSLSGLTSQHPGYAAANQELAQIEREIAAQSEILGKDVTRSLRARYEMTVEQARRYEASLQDALRQQEKSSARFASLFNEALTLTGEVKQYNKDLEAVRDRLNFFADERGALGFVRLVTPALAPDLPTGLGRKKLLLLVLAAALFAALALPVAQDLADRRVRTVNDAERTLGMSSLGWMIERKGMAAELFAEDQLRRIAGGLIREQDKHGTQVFAVCGVKPGAGSSELTLALARTLDTLGYPTLAVEANAFRPDARYAHGKPGLVQCLQAQVPPQACVIAADAQAPARVCVGAAPGQHHLDRIDRAESVMRQWAAEFRFVLVDMPPLLLSADAEILLSRLGQVLLVVEAGGISHGELARAGRVLEKTATQAVGVIVNRVQPLVGGGYIRDLLVEFLLQRKFSQFETQPAWLLQLQSLWPALSQGLRQSRRRAQT